MSAPRNETTYVVDNFASAPLPLPREVPIAVSLSPDDAARVAQVRRWQFSLRALMAVLAGFSVLFALGTLAGAVASTLAAWLLVLVCGHVAANRWGTRLPTARTGGHRQPIDLPTFRPVPQEAHAAHDSALRGREVANRSKLPFTAFGAVSGFLLGTIVLASTYWGRASLTAVLVGAFSSGVLGAFCGWLARAFFNVATAAIGDASTPAAASHDDTL